MVTTSEFTATVNGLVVEEQVDMLEKCILVPAVWSSEFFNEQDVLENAELQLFQDRVLAIDYLVFEMVPALVGCRFGDVVYRLHTFSRPGPLRSEGLRDGRSQLQAASRLMQGLNPSQQARLQLLLNAGVDGAAPATSTIRIEDEQRSSVLSAPDTKEDRAKVVKVKPVQAILVREFAAVSELWVTRCVQFNSKTYYICTRLDVH